MFRNNKLQTALLTAVLGVSLLSVGTFAYFSDSAQTNNTFAAGVLDLSVEPTEIIQVDNLKPGDSIARTFELYNNGTLDISKVFLETTYTVDDVKGDNSEDFGEHIEVEFLHNIDKVQEVLFQTTLAKLQSMSPEVINENVFHPLLDDEGLPVGTSDDLIVKFNFIDNGQDQNQFQGDILKLEWTFKALQTTGEEK